MCTRDKLILMINSVRYPHLSRKEFMELYKVTRLVDARVCDLKEYVESKNDSCTRCG